MNIILSVLFSALGYIIGSIPWALIVSKLFFKQDIRELGSKNPGGSNIARTYGLKWGLIVIALDASKAIVAMLITYLLFKPGVIYAGFCACIGHCLSVFIDFKGGKGVATTYGFLLGLSIFTDIDALFTFVYPLLFFLAILCFFKYVSLASMMSLVIETVIAFITCETVIIKIMILLLTALVVVRHRSNINRLLEGKENKVSFII